MGPGVPMRAGRTRQPAVRRGPRRDARDEPASIASLHSTMGRPTRSIARRRSCTGAVGARRRGTTTSGPPAPRRTAATIRRPLRHPRDGRVAHGVHRGARPRGARARTAPRGAPQPRRRRAELHPHAAGCARRGAHPGGHAAPPGPAATRGPVGRPGRRRHAHGGAQWPPTRPGPGQGRRARRPARARGTLRIGTDVTSPGAASRGRRALSADGPQAEVHHGRPDRAPRPHSQRMLAL